MRMSAVRKQYDSSGLFFSLLKREGLPVPEREWRFARTDNPPRNFRIDYAWPDLKVGLEVDGGIWTAGRHTRGAGWLKDTEKLNLAASLGWRMLRCTPDQLTDLRTIAILKRALTP